MTVFIENENSAEFKFDYEKVIRDVIEEAVAYVDCPFEVNVDEKNELVAEIANNSGTLLPGTGGIGTTMFYVIGGILVLVAMVLLVIKGRMKED